MSKQLTLAKETLRSLNGAEVAQIAGAVMQPTSTVNPTHYQCVKPTTTANPTVAGCVHITTTAQPSKFIC
jgi:hypothetical protein